MEQLVHEHGIVVGTKASGTYWSDFTPFEVIKVSDSGKTITIREMNWRIVSGQEYNGTAEYEYESNPHGSIYSVRFSKNKGWKTPDGMRIMFGNARRYYDPSF